MGFMQIDFVDAIRQGDIPTLERLLAANPAVIQERPDGKRTLLHIATDWPGHFPNVQKTIELLAAKGADLNAAFGGDHSETPLHWASSSNDVEAIDALLDHGANIEAQGSVIDGGAPLQMRWRLGNGARHTD